MTNVMTPPGWQTKPLGQIATIDRQSVLPRNILKETTYVGLENIDGEGRFIDIHKVSNGELASNKFAFSNKHILYGKLRPYLRKIARPSFSGVCSTDIVPLCTLGEVHRDYLFHYLRQQHLIDLATTRSAGANLPRLSPSQLAAFPVAYPPLPEQRRIAAILDKADGIRRKREEGIRLTEDLLRSTFLDMFGDPVANVRKWQRTQFSDLLDNIDSGWSPKCHDRPVADGEWGVLKLGAVTYCKYQAHENKALPESESPRPELEVKPGDLLMTRKNTYELVAATAFVFQTPQRLMLPDLIFRFRLKPDAPVRPEYLWGLLTHPGKRKTIQSLAGGSAGSMPNISKEKLLRHAIEIPPLSLQEKFCELMHKLHKTEKHRAEIAAQHESLCSALVQRAFLGEL